MTKIPGDGVLLQKPDLLQNCPTLHSALEPQRHGAEAARFSKGPHGSKVLFVSEKIPDDELSGRRWQVPLRKYPTLHDAHLAPSLVHSDPVAGDPLLQVHVNAAHAPPLRP